MHASPPTPEPGGGRPTTRHLGLDLGGTFIKWVVVEHDGSEWRAIDRDQVPTPAEGGPTAVVGELARIGGWAIQRCRGVASVGIGVPGLYDPATGTARFMVNLPGEWAGVPIAAEVGRALSLPAFLVNDARAFGLAELRLGAGRGASSMVGLTLGTGVGGVIAVGGRVHQGHDGTAGEVGHQTIVPDGPWCGCGNRGCLEAFAKAEAIADACGTATADQGIELARAGDARALEGIRQVGRYLGIGIANMIVVITPDRVVIGGGIGAALDLLIGPIQAELERRVQVTALEQVEVVGAELGTWAGAVGAAVHGAERAIEPG
ncbi:MAG TPA: ROK family protein [Candidatus Limnocylindrales bacterium]|nr:ROK family protein [Candidatus Limnocylindrales bacterium]